MSYTLRVERSAEKSLTRRIDARDAGRIREATEALAEEPRPQASSKLLGEEGYRLRVGNYRVLYLIDDDARSVTVTKIVHRREVYRG